MEHLAFTTRHSGRVNVLKTKVKVCLPLTEEEAKTPTAVMKEYVAIWDTGATNSVITKRVVDDLGLKPINVVETHHAGGTSMANAYLVNIVLPNKVMMGQVRVTEMQLVENKNLSDDDQSRVLIGMDIIGMGDFAVTNLDGKTMMSFHMPSVREIDFVPASTEHNVMEGGNRKQRRAMMAQKRKF